MISPQNYLFRPFPAQHYKYAHPGKNFIYRYPDEQVSPMLPNHRMLSKLTEIVDFYDRYAYPNVKKRWKQARVRMLARFPVRFSERAYMRNAFANIPHRF